jgi:hypothetical protein
MNKTIVVTNEQLGWLVNGVEVELAANYQHSKTEMPPDDLDTMKRDAADLEALLMLLQGA